jgi:hypothetical protein
MAETPPRPTILCLSVRKLRGMRQDVEVNKPSKRLFGGSPALDLATGGAILGCCCCWRLGFVWSLMPNVYFTSPSMFYSRGDGCENGAAPER